MPKLAHSASLLQAFEDAGLLPPHCGDLTIEANRNTRIHDRVVVTFTCLIPEDAVLDVLSRVKPYAQLLAEEQTRSQQRRAELQAAATA